MTKIVKNVSITCFHEELCQIYNARKTALSILCEGSRVTMLCMEALSFMLIAEGGTVLACPLNVSLFNIRKSDLIDGVKVADLAHYYKEALISADMNLTF